MTRCRTCRGLMVEEFEDDAEIPGCAKLKGWRCLKCGAAVEETETTHPPCNPTWLQGRPSDSASQAARMIYSLHDGLRRRMTGGGSSPFGSSLQAYVAWEEHEKRFRERHWWA